MLQIKFRNGKPVDDDDDIDGDDDINKEMNILYIVLSAVTRPQIASSLFPTP